jgi:hypothetical protein
MNKDIENEIKIWIQENYSYNPNSAFLLILDYINKNDINWNSDYGKSKVKKEMDALFDEKEKVIEYNDNIKPLKLINPFDVDSELWKHLKRMEQTFEDPDVSDDEYSYSENIKKNGDLDNLDIYEDIEDDIEKSKNLSKKINESTLPVEVKELLIKSKNEAYISPVLYNLNRLGLIKQFRRAIILQWLKRNGNI